MDVGAVADPQRVGSVTHGYSGHMGSWGSGIFDNDAALDSVGEMLQWVREDIRSLTDQRCSSSTAQHLAAAIGVLLELDERFFRSGDGLEEIQAAIVHQASGVESLSPRAGEILRRVVAGDIGDSSTTKLRSGALRTILGGYLDGRWESSLFDGEGATAFATKFVAKLAEIVEQDLEAHTTDLLDLAGAIGLVGLLLLVFYP